MNPLSLPIGAALDTACRAQLTTATASTWRQLFASDAWRRTPAAIASDDDHQTTRAREALEDASAALESLLSWGGRRADPDGQLLALQAAISEVLPVLGTQAENDISDDCGQCSGACRIPGGGHCGCLALMAG